MLSRFANRRTVYQRDKLERLIDPKTVAVIGLSRNESSFGARTARNLSHFSGRAYGVNPNAETLSGLPCFPSVAAVPQAVDCAVLAVPLERVEQIVEECAAARVGGCVIYASGFAETGRPERIVLQARLAAIGRDAGMRIVGPNCLGLVNNLTRAGLSFSASYADRLPAAGPVAIVSQSGGLGQAIAQASERGGAYSHFLAAGNSCDVDVCDYVSYLVDEPACRVIACAAEGLVDGERLLEAAERALAADKPIVFYKFARGPEAAKAAKSHTGTLAGENAAYEAAFRRLGVISVDNIEDIYETASFLAKAGRPTASGVGAVAASGGACVITLDKAAAYGVPMPMPSPATQAILDANVPDFGNAGNPCDVTAQVANNPASYAACAEAMLGDPSYGALVVLATGVNPAVTSNNVAMFAGLGADAGKPVCLSYISEWRAGPGSAECEANPHISIFKSTESVFRTLSSWLERERRLDASPRGRRGPPHRASGEASRVLARAGPTLTKTEAMSVLALYGVPFGAHHRGEQVGLEFVVGSRFDPTFGPLVLVSLGGTLAELIGETAVDLAPVDQRQAREMIVRLLRGRSPAADVEGIAEIIVGVSELAGDRADEIDEISVNPIICGSSGAVAVDASIVRRSA